MNAFDVELTRRIKEHIRAAKKQGTVSMSVDCLRQCVPNPPAHLEGAPGGWNPPAAYRARFIEVCDSEPTIQAFILAK